MTLLVPEEWSRDNVATDDGGALVAGAGVTIDTCTFRDNVATEDGGALVLIDAVAVDSSGNGDHLTLDPMRP